MWTKIHKSVSSYQPSLSIYEEKIDRRALGGALFTLSQGAVGNQPQGKPCKLSALSAYWV